MNERKKLFVQMDIMEQQTLIMLWRKLTLGNKSRHCVNEMYNRCITDEMIQDAWKNNHIIEFKVVNGEKRMLVRSTREHYCHYDICRGGRKVGYSKEKTECNVCLVVNIDNGEIITCYSCPVSMKKDYVNKVAYDSSYDYAMDVRAELKE